MINWYDADGHLSEDMVADFRQTLLTWYDESGRTHLPWRIDKEPYHIWVSEIMLQQTQVETVIPYYERFLAELPRVQDLAEADEEVLLKLWSGLGYYSRIRNMQKAAQQVMADFDGQFPTTSQALQTLAGIGPYTAAAIASISFNEVVPALDGNMFRVFARLLKIDADIAQPKSRKIFYDIILPIVDPERPGDFNQAVMDLGTSLMRAKTETLADSPFARFNLSYQEGIELNFPVKSKKVKQVQKFYAAIISEKNGSMAYTQRPKTGLLANFWTYPLVEFDSWDAIYDGISEQFKAAKQLNITPVTHIFTHQKWQVMLVQVENEDATWTYLSDDAYEVLPQTTLQLKLQAALKENL
ncbi:MAG: A/G-specific adenine glycosylase [Pseudolactococcus laudensis]|uniref:Adenine DNA glycosylase n=1 Tax=Pseudolactococcus laudensis TaxID=1494461 RepID=A0A7V8N256_9LACT|nr:A/G-specific adenine glycosylase [Lactococcus laudensis]MBA0017214.1 A/G-specific adenine glycosylase [Lactococcus laudensis]MBW9282001.1 A/G-specific adenine glycosylase [Lactococcus laudensis]